MEQHYVALGRASSTITANVTVSVTDKPSILCKATNLFSCNGKLLDNKEMAARHITHHQCNKKQKACIAKIKSEEEEEEERPKRQNEVNAKIITERAKDVIRKA